MSFRHLPVMRLPSPSWDLWPSRNDDWFHNRWSDWMTNMQRTFDAMDEDFRQISRAFDNHMEQTHRSVLGSHTETDLPANVGWKLVDDKEKNQRKLHLDLPVKNYEPEEIKVTVEGGTLTIKATHQHEKDGEKVFRECVRKFTLPKGVKEEDLKCNLNADGRLSVEAVAPAAISDGEKVIPIQYEKSK
ncbi:unnamed protein product [Dimorphilus gyrociliatus]|uniref:SHSP domain-containing protein n=1 Tax=Dimorphilus gyrociliatus TaxID=2664684 RepID=A0A7I8VRU3_9ANNE|nr:unnamed protein product [Dimorphilus gyrociliatus]CAD5118993.1 unnamed protein product [Dimorphilus gyrociliatus]